MRACCPEGGYADQRSEKVRATIDTADIKFVGKVAARPCSCRLARNLSRGVTTDQEVPLPLGVRAVLQRRFKLVRDKIPCDNGIAHDYFTSAVKVAKKWSRSGARVNVFPYDGKPGSEICVTFSCEADAVEPFKEQVIKQVDDDEQQLSA